MAGIKVIITGATGMVGEGVLFECLQNAEVAEVLIVNRRHYEWQHPKLKELILPDFFQLDKHAEQVTGYDACFFCAGISSVGMKEDKFRHITYDTTLAFAKSLLKVNSNMVFTYVSGSHTDSTEKGRLMWARVKGKTENALMRLPFKAVYLFRPGIVRPLDGIVSRTTVYRIAYIILKPVIPLLASRFPDHITSTRQIGIAMIEVARRGFPKHVLENKDINSIKRN
jgi:uncharacterized protein YbjT (DUF2867 family)